MADHGTFSTMEKDRLHDMTDQQIMELKIRRGIFFWNRLSLLGVVISAIIVIRNLYFGDSYYTRASEQAVRLFGLYFWWGLVVFIITLLMLARIEYVDRVKEKIEKERI